MVLRMKTLIFLGFTERSDFKGGLEKPIYREDCLKGGLGKKEGGVFEGELIPHTPMPTIIILSHLELSRIDLPKLNSSILIEIVTISVGQVDKFYFYMQHPIKAWLFEKVIFELVYLFHIILKSLVSY